MDNQTVFAISIFFHLLATAIWIGGLLLLVLLVFPEAQRSLEAQTARADLLGRVRKRFAPLSGLSLAVLITTGMIQMSLDPNYDGLMQITNAWSVVLLVKHLVIGLMIAAGAALQYLVVPALERATLRLKRAENDPAASAEWGRLRTQEVRLTWVSVALGVLVLALSAWAGSL